MEKNLLYFLLGNVDMGKTFIQYLIEISNDQSFKKQLLEDLEQYEAFYDKIVMLKTDSEEIKPVSALAKISAQMSVKMKTIQDKSPAKLSNLLLDGLDMGIADVKENIEKAKRLSDRPKVIALAEEYLVFLTASKENYKRFR